MKEEIYLSSEEKQKMSTLQTFYIFKLGQSEFKYSSETVIGNCFR